MPRQNGRVSRRRTKRWPNVLSIQWLEWHDENSEAACFPNVNRN
jgi:hypothetical protein